MQKYKTTKQAYEHSSKCIETILVSTKKKETVSSTFSFFILEKCKKHNMWLFIEKTIPFEHVEKMSYF